MLPSELHSKLSASFREDEYLKDIPILPILEVNVDFRHTEFRSRIPLVAYRRASVAQRQRVGLGIERSRIRNLLVPYGFSHRQRN